MKLSPRVGQRVGQRLEQARDQARERLGRGEEPAPPPPDAPGDRPRAAFAGVLDGRHLWLAVEATPGTLSLRELAGHGQDGQDGQDGRVVALDSDLVEDDPRFRSVRSDLTALPGAGDAAYEIVLSLPGGGGKVERVWTPPLPAVDALTTPTAGGVQWELRRSTDGTLELTRADAEPGALLLGIESDPRDPDETVTLRLAGAAEGAELRLVDDDGGAVLLTRRMTHADGVATVTLSPGDIPGDVGLSAAVHAGDLPVRRRANELRRPDTAVLLPQHQSDDGRSVAVVYRWLPDGVLRIRRPKAGTP